MPGVVMQQVGVEPLERLTVVLVVMAHLVAMDAVTEVGVAALKCQEQAEKVVKGERQEAAEAAGAAVQPKVAQAMMAHAEKSEFIHGR